MLNPGWQFNDKRIERLWRQEEGKKGQPGLNYGPCVRRLEYRNHVWTDDLVHCRANGGKALQSLNIVDEFSRYGMALVAS